VLIRARIAAFVSHPSDRMVSDRDSSRSAGSQLVRRQ
jgi:hypothetical protein